MKCITHIVIMMLTKWILAFHLRVNIGKIQTGVGGKSRITIWSKWETLQAATLLNCGIRNLTGREVETEEDGKGVKLIFMPSMQKIESGNRHALIKIPKWGSSFALEYFLMQLLLVISMKLTQSPFLRPLRLSEPLNFLQTTAGLRLMVGRVRVDRKDLLTVSRWSWTTHPHVQLRIHTLYDWFPLRAEIWPSRQVYGRKTDSFAASSLLASPLGGPDP